MILLGRLGRDLLDIHAAFGAGDHRDALGLAIDQHAKIELARDFAGLLDIDSPHDSALGPGLMSHQRFAEQLARRNPCLGGAGDQLDAAGLAATAGVDLRLDDGLGLPKRFEGLRRFVGGSKPAVLWAPARRSAPDTCLA